MAIGPTSLSGLLAPGREIGNSGEGPDKTDDGGQQTGDTGSTGSTGSSQDSGTTQGTTETGSTDPISAPEGTTRSDTTGDSRSNAANIAAPTRADPESIVAATSDAPTDAEAEIANARALAEAYQAEARQRAILETISSPVEATSLDALTPDAETDQGDPFANGNGADLTAVGRDR